MIVSPLVNTERKGGAYVIMLQQFRWAIGVTIARGNAEHKMARLHYVRTTAEEAKTTCNSHHSDNKWKPSRSSNWYSSHTPAGYSTFKQFRNRHDFNMH